MHAVTGCHVGCQEVSRCHTKGESGECIACRWQSMQRIHPGFETQGRRHQKVKTGVSVTPQKGLLSNLLFFLKSFISMIKIIPIATGQLKFIVGNLLHAHLLQKQLGDRYCSQTVFTSMKDLGFKVGSNQRFWTSEALRIRDNLVPLERTLFYIFKICNFVTLISKIKIAQALKLKHSNQNYTSTHPVSYYFMQ